MPDEKILAELHAPMFFHIGTALKIWFAVFIFILICFGISLLFHNQTLLGISIVIFIQAGLFIRLIVWSIKQRSLKALIISNYRVMKHSDEASVWINLEEIKEVNVQQTNSWFGNKLEIIAGTKLEFMPLKKADDVAGFILKMQRRKKEGKTRFPLYKTS